MSSGRTEPHRDACPTSSYAAGRSSRSSRDGVSPRNTESRSRTLNGSATRRIDSRKCDAISRAISRNDIVRPSRVRQSHTSMSHANGFFGKCDSRASQPLRAMCRPGFNPSMSGTPHASRSRKRYESHSMMSRVMPTISAVAAAISPGSGVKSKVISTRSRRGRTPMPVDRRFAAKTITGTGSNCTSSTASF